MSAVGATGIYSFLNDGVILDQNGFTDSLALWQGENDDTEPTLCTFAKEGFELPVAPTGHTIILSANIAPPPPIIPSVGQVFIVYPGAIQVFFVLDMRQDGVPNEDLPTGILLTPAIWNLETLPA